MLAIGMNGEPLPVEHGFPVRMVIPGLYGYVSACKWLARIEATTFDAFDAYWVQRGWAPDGPIKVASRIDTAGADSGLPRRPAAHRRRGLGPDPRHRPGRGAGRRAAPGRRPARRRTVDAGPLAPVGPAARLRPGPAHRSPCARPTADGEVQPQARPIRSPPAPPAGTRSRSSSADGDGTPLQPDAGLRQMPWTGPDKEPIPVTRTLCPAASARAVERPRPGAERLRLGATDGHRHRPRTRRQRERERGATVPAAASTRRSGPAAPPSRAEGPGSFAAMAGGRVVTAASAQPALSSAGRRR